MSVEDGIEPSGAALAIAWANYRKDLNAVVPGPLAEQVRKLWCELEKRAGFPAPDAGPTSQGSFVMSWDRGQHHLEIEIFAEGRHEWFYCDRETDLYDGSAGSRRQAVSAITDYARCYALFLESNIDVLP